MFDIERIFIVVFTTKIILHKAFDIEDAEGLQQSSHWVEHTGGWREHWLWISFSPELSQNLARSSENGSRFGLDPGVRGPAGHCRV